LSIESNNSSIESYLSAPENQIPSTESNPPAPESNTFWGVQPFFEEIFEYLPMDIDRKLFIKVASKFTFDANRQETAITKILLRNVTNTRIFRL
jgi:hypothetical protein